MAFPPTSILGKKTPKIKKSAAKHFEGLAALSTIQRDGGRQSRPGVNPFISALTVARCPAIFPGMWPHFGTLCPQVGAQYEGRGFHIRPVC